MITARMRAVAYKELLNSLDLATTTKLFYP